MESPAYENCSGPMIQQIRILSSCWNAPVNMIYRLWECREAIEMGMVSDH